MRVQFAVGLGRVGPVIGRAGFLLRRRADEGELLDPRDIVRVGAMQITAGRLFLVELDQDALPAGFAEQVIVLRLRAVAPEDVFRLGQRLDFVHPIEDGLIGRFVFTHATGRAKWQERYYP